MNRETLIRLGREFFPHLTPQMAMLSILAILEAQGFVRRHG
jgi:hypothetical protein